MKSMTGFGASEAQAGDVRFTIEIRSVNQRHLDIKLVLPREFAAWEGELRRTVGESIERGRVEVFVSRTAAGGTKDVVLNKQAAAAYVNAWKRLKKDFKLAGEIDLSLLQGRSEIFQPVESRGKPKQEIAALKKALGNALASHERDRIREGRHLQRDMGAREKRLSSVHTRIQRRVKKLAPLIQRRLDERLEKLLGGREIDPARLAQEVAIIADRGDVTEETVRLKSHLANLRALLSESSSVGKRIDFLLQEINREFNTIGSKAGDLEVTNLVLDAKAELEKIREQVQNVE